jgi:hypothetical protein
MRHQINSHLAHQTNKYPIPRKTPAHSLAGSALSKSISTMTLAAQEQMVFSG